MVGHGGSSAGSYLADPTSPIPSHCASIVVTSTVRVNLQKLKCFVKVSLADADKLICVCTIGSHEHMVLQIQCAYRIHDGPILLRNSLIA